MIGNNRRPFLPRLWACPLSHLTIGAQFRLCTSLEAGFRSYLKNETSNWHAERQRRSTARRLPPHEATARSDQRLPRYRIFFQALSTSASLGLSSLLQTSKTCISTPCDPFGPQLRTHVGHGCRCLSTSSRVDPSSRFHVIKRRFFAIAFGPAFSTSERKAHISTTAGPIQTSFGTSGRATSPCLLLSSQAIPISRSPAVRAFVWPLRLGSSELASSLSN